MTLQLGLVLIMIGVAAAYLGWTSWQNWRKIGGSGCCGKAQTGAESTVTFIPADSLEVRRDRRTTNGQLG